jgi:hypothetical protein
MQNTFLFTIVLVAQSCSKYDTVKVGTNVNAPLQPDAGNDITICYGSSIVLDATPAQSIMEHWVHGR